MDNIKKELGDLFLHIVFYSKIASETNDFNITDVINSVCDKLVHRHPHIYGDVKVKDEVEVKKNWEKLKMKEGKKLTANEKVVIFESLQNFIDSIICLNSALLYRKLPSLGRIIGCIGVFSFNDFIIEFFEGVNPPFSLFLHNSILLISNFDISVQSLILNAHISKL